MLNLTSTTAKRNYLLETIRENITFERGIYRRLTPLIDRQARAAAKKYEETEDLIATLTTIYTFDETWEKYLNWQHNRVGDHVGKKIFKALKSERYCIETKNFDSFRAAFRLFVQEQVAENVQKIQETTVGLIHGAVESATSSGLSGYEVSKEIYNHVSGIGRINAKVRSRLIARTETHSAYNHAGQIAGEESGYDLEKEWLSAEGERTRPEHAAADGQTVGMREKFIVGGEELMYPGDQTASAENICNCRCAMG